MEIALEREYSSIPLNEMLALQKMHAELLSLREDMVNRAQARLVTAAYLWPDQDREYSAANLCMYLAFRHHDIRPLQDRLAQAGLSSLGRGEPDILDNIDRVIGLLAQATGHSAIVCAHGNRQPQGRSGRQILADRNEALFGQSQSNHYTRIMTTMPSAAADNYALVESLINSGMSCARINCAHDHAQYWERMVSFIRRAGTETGIDCRIFMDLAGMKIRTGPLGSGKHGDARIRLFEGDLFDLRVDAKSSVPATINPMSNSLQPAVIACSSALFLDHVNAGESVWIDDGKLGAIIENTWDKGVRLRVTHAGPKGVRIGAGKGINFPDSRSHCPY